MISVPVKYHIRYLCDGFGGTSIDRPFYRLAGRNSANFHSLVFARTPHQKNTWRGFLLSPKTKSEPWTCWRCFSFSSLPSFRNSSICTSNTIWHRLQRASQWQWMQPKHTAGDVLDSLQMDLTEPLIVEFKGRQWNSNQSRLHALKWLLKWKSEGRLEGRWTWSTTSCKLWTPWCSEENINGNSVQACDRGNVAHQWRGSKGETLESWHHVCLT